MNEDSLIRENQAYEGTHGISQRCRGKGFQPAFRDAHGRVELSRQRNGEPATIHLISWLPQEWAASISVSGAIVTLKPGIVSGFVRGGNFFTREEAASQGDNALPVKQEIPPSR